MSALKCSEDAPAPSSLNEEAVLKGEQRNQELLQGKKKNQHILDMLKAFQKARQGWKLTDQDYGKAVV